MYTLNSTQKLHTVLTQTPEKDKGFSRFKVRLLHLVAVLHDPDMHLISRELCMHLSIEQPFRSQAAFQRSHTITLRGHCSIDGESRPST